MQILLSLPDILILELWMKMVFIISLVLFLNKEMKLLILRKNLIDFKEAYQFDVNLKMNEGKEYISKYDFRVFKEKKDNKPKNN